MHQSERRAFTAYLDLLVLRFSAHRSSTASLDMLYPCRYGCLQNLPFHTTYLLRCIDVLSDDAKMTTYEFEDYLRSGQGSIVSHRDFENDCST